MVEPSPSTHQIYLAWVEDRIEQYKASIARDELLDLAEEAVRELHGAPDGQYALTEILLRDTVDALIFQRLKLPSYRAWLRRRDRQTPASSSGTDSASAG
jgi:hypothetical protein